MRAVVVAAFVAATQVASAAPHGARAKADFDRGVKAYQRSDYAAAADAFKRSFNAEADVETLFAWAQAERQQDHCELAIELYRKLDGFSLPAKNREVVIAKRQECQAIVDAQRPRSAPIPEPKHSPRRPPRVDPDPLAALPPEPPADGARPPERHARPGRAWYLDPTGDVLTGVGAISIGIGIGYLVGSYNASVATSTSAEDFAANHALSDHDGKIGVGFSAAGAVVLAAGLLRYSMLHPSDTTAVTAWSTSTSGGLTLRGRF